MTDNTNNTNTSPPETPEQRRLLRARANALTQLPEKLDRAAALVRALGGSVKLTTETGGRRSIKRKERTMTFGPDAASLAQGTIFQRPSQAALQVAIACDTMEAQVLQEFTAAVPEKQRDLHVLRAATREALYDLWLCGDEEALHLGAAGRRAPLHMRPDIAKVVALAHAKGKEAAKRTRQAIATLPALVRFVPAEALVAAADAGQSVITIAEAHGGAKILGKLDRHSLLLVTPENVGTVCAILNLVRDIRAPETKGKHYREWLGAMLRWWRFGEVVPGFNAWLAKVTFAAAPHRSMLTSYMLLELTLWAEASHDKRGGWNDKRSFSRAALEAATWADGMSDQAKRDKAVTLLAEFDEKRAATFANRRCVRPLRNSGELFAAGLALDNCLRIFTSRFAAEAAAGRAVYLGVYSVKTKTDPQTEAISYVADKLVSAAEVRLDPEGKPLGIRQHSAWGNSRPLKADADAVAAWIAERL